MDFLQETEKRLDLPPAVKAEVMRELESHLAEIRAELVASGQTDVDAQAQERLGSPEDVAARLNAVHNSASWHSAVLSAAPFLALASVLVLRSYGFTRLCLSLIAIIGAIAAAGSVRELIRGRRPIWLATWLAAAFLCTGITLIWIAKSTSLTTDRPGGEWAIYCGFVAVSTLAAALIARRALLLVLILCLVYVLCAGQVLREGMDASWPAFMYVRFAAWVFLLVLARTIFETHPYGNGTQGSMFLMSLISLGYATTPDELLLPYQLMAALLTAGLVLMAARNPKRGLKSNAISAALFAQGLLWGLGSEIEHPTGRLVISVIGVIFTGLIWTGLMQFYVLWPLRSEDSRRIQIEPPQVAQ